MTRWTPEAKQKLRLLAPTHSTVELAELFGCSPNAVRVQARYAGIPLSRRPSPRWRASTTPDEAPETSSAALEFTQLSHGARQRLAELLRAPDADSSAEEPISIRGEQP